MRTSESNQVVLDHAIFLATRNQDGRYKNVNDINRSKNILLGNQTKLISKNLSND